MPEKQLIKKRSLPETTLIEIILQMDHFNNLVVAST